MRLITRVKERVALYDYFRTRRLAWQERAFSQLGNRCSSCGSQNGLRIRFLDCSNPLAVRYRTNHVTLFRRICLEPELRDQVRLLCRECRLSSNLSEGGKPWEVFLENPSEHEGKREEL